MLVTDYETALEACRTPEALWALIGRYFHGSDVERIVYLHLPPIGSPDERSPRSRADGYPDELVSRYLAERSVPRQPDAPRRAGERRAGLLGRRSPTTRARDARAGLRDESTSHGLGAGVGIPVYGPNGRVGHCGLGFRAGVRRLAREMLREFQVGCQFGHLQLLRHARRRSSGAADDLLGRENEVLAPGRPRKSNTMIGASSASPPIPSL